MRGVALLLWSTRPEDPALAATPFMHAAAAAAMDLEVEIHFSAQSVRLLLPGVAEAVYADTTRKVPIATFMREAREHGAKFLACTASMANLGVTRAELDAQVDGYAGASSFQARAADPTWRVLVF